MKKFLVSLCLFTVFMSTFAVEASAKDMARRFAIGVDAPIAQFDDDNHGLSVIYYINRFFGLQLILGVSTYNVSVSYNKDNVPTGYKAGSVDVSITDWNVSLRGLVPIVLSTDVNLSAVIGFTAAGRANDGFKANESLYPDAVKYNDGYNFSIDIGVRPEWFVSDHFSIHTQVGIGINIITNDGSASNPVTSPANGSVIYTAEHAKGVNVDFFKNVDLLGQAGFTFWF